MRVDEHTITLDQAPVYYRTADPVSGPVLYLHDVPTSSDDWTEFLERTGGVAPDLIGFGRTSKAGHLDYSIAGEADFVDRFMDSLGIGRFALVAHGWGAAAGLVLAQRRPERIERLVLIDALPLLEGFRWPRLARMLRTPGVGELIMGGTPKWLLARALRASCARPEVFSAERLGAIWDQFDQGTQRAILRLHRSSDEQALVALGAGLGDLDMPALVIWGESDTWFDPRFADAYAARLVAADAHRIAQAGHWPWLDQPEVIDLVAQFLR